jgi:hypothetical protein
MQQRYRALEGRLDLRPARGGKGDDAPELLRVVRMIDLSDERTGEDEAQGDGSGSPEREAHDELLTGKGLFDR